MHLGGCACGKVTYVIQIAEALKSVSVCHCTTCQAWSGGISLYFEAQGDNVKIDGKDNLSIWKSSEYCERAFCKVCGSSIYSRVTVSGPMENVHHFCAGTLQNWAGIDHIHTEIFIDRKPPVYDLKCDSKKMTSTEFLALFS